MSFLLNPCNASAFRMFSLLAYLLILLPGMLTIIPFCFFLVIGIFVEGAFFMKFIIILIDVCIIYLVIQPIHKRNSLTLILEIICFLAMISPFVWIFSNIKLSDIESHLLTIIPLFTFVFFFLLATFVAHKNFQLDKFRDNSSHISARPAENIKR
jgi:hypothetical protein